MADDSARLEILIEANLKSMNSALTKLEGDVSKAMSNSSKSVETLNSSIKSMQDAALKAAGALGIAFSVHALTDFVKSNIEAGKTIAETSQKLGLSAEAYQTLNYAAQQAGVSTDALSAAFKGMTVFVGNVERGAKASKQELADLGLTLGDIKGKAPDQIFTILAGAIGKIQDPITRNAEALKIFGKTAADVIPLAVQGAQGIDQLRQKAVDLGLVISNDTIAKTKEAGDKLATIGDAAQVAGINMASAFTPAIDALYKLITDPNFQQGLTTTAATLGTIVTWLAQNPAAASALIGAAGGFMVGGLPGAFVGAAGGAVAEVAATSRGGSVAALQAANAGQPFGETGGLGDMPTVAAPPAMVTVLHADGTTETITADEFNRRMNASGGIVGGPGFAPPPAGSASRHGPGTFPSPPAPALAGVGTGIGGGITDQAAQAAAEAMQKKTDALAASLQLEIEKLTETARAQAIDTEAAKLGSGATQEQTDKIKALAAQFYDAKLRADALTKAATFFGDQMYSALDGILTKSTSLEATMKNLALAIAQAVIQAELLGTGPLAGLLGTGAPGGAGGGAVGGLIGTAFRAFGFADGGNVQGGRPIVVGERGPELWVPPSSGSIIPNGAFGGAGGGHIQIEINANELFDARVAKAAAPVSLSITRQGIAQYHSAVRLAGVTGADSAGLLR